MGDKESIDRLIDKQINGTITEMELIQLDLLIKDNPSFANELQLKTDISNAMKYVGNKELKAKLEHIHKDEIDKNSATKFLNLKWILGVAALFLGGLLIFQFAFDNRINRINEKQLFTDFYKPYQASFQSRDQSNDKWFLYKDAYLKGEYNKALSIVTPDLENANNEILLAAGISALEVGQFELGKDIFIRIIEQKDFYFKDHAIWYIGLIHLKEQNNNLAKEQFQLLMDDPNADHHDEAKNILSQLNH